MLPFIAKIHIRPTVMREKTAYTDEWTPNL